MKFLCIGYFDLAKSAARPKNETAAIMAKCGPHLARLLEKKHVLHHTGLETETRSIRRVDGTVSVTDAPFLDSAQRIGVSFVVDASDIDEAVDVASMHRAIAVSEGETLGWGIEVRPIDSFERAHTA